MLKKVMSKILPRKPVKEQHTAHNRRPITGSCPQCKASQTEYCRDWCTLIDVCSMARE